MILGMTEIINNEIDGVTYEGACAENIKCAIEKMLNLGLIDIGQAQQMEQLTPNGSGDTTNVALNV